jgi:hypothetical protein
MSAGTVQSRDRGGDRTKTNTFMHTLQTSSSAEPIQQPVRDASECLFYRETIENHRKILANSYLDFKRLVGYNWRMDANELCELQAVPHCGTSPVHGELLVLSTTDHEVNQPTGIRPLRERTCLRVAPLDTSGAGDGLAERFVERLGGAVSRERRNKAKDCNDTLHWQTRQASQTKPGS